MSEEKSKIQYLLSILYISKIHYNKVFVIIPINLSFFFFFNVCTAALSFEVPAWGYFMIHEIIMFAFSFYKFQQPTEVLG